ncbi:XVIPCD domain-containing protein [Xanthomonas sacchari]|uniref:VgrG-related protein n=1 Tax=Xanthomonas sacchari TaxID=56458 RepID=UPI001FC9E030|nr:XVIPCD domain-containing protein [Xanthomonas sacchari]
MTSSRYESGGRGAGTISTGKGDHGGVSYGTYQLSSAAGTLSEYLSSSRYGSEFKGLAPNSDAFTARWRQLANEDPAFGQDQHDFIRRTHYDVQVSKLAAAGIDLRDRGPAVQDALWSTSVQFRELTPGIFQRGLSEKFGDHYRLSELSDKQIIEAVQDYKYSHTANLFKSSPTYWDSLRARALDEKQDLIELSEGRLPARTHVRNNGGHDPLSDGRLTLGERGEVVKQMQGQLAHLGLTGRDGKPLHPDGDFGPNTRYAVKQFQREHGLDVDGVVGTKTRAALDQAVAKQSPLQQAATKSEPLLSDSSHPQHALYADSVRELEKLGERGGFANRKELEQAAGQMAFEAKVSGLQRIDHVVPSTDGRGLIGVQGELNDPAMRRVYLDREQAQAQPLQESTRQMADEVQRQSQTQQVESREPVAMSR